MRSSAVSPLLRVICYSVIAEPIFVTSPAPIVNTMSPSRASFFTQRSTVSIYLTFKPRSAMASASFSAVVTPSGFSRAAYICVIMSSSVSSNAVKIHPTEFLYASKCEAGKYI